MRGTVRGFVLGAATALVVVPFVAIAQEAPPEVEPEVEPAPAPEPELEDAPEAGQRSQEDGDAPVVTAEEPEEPVADAETERPEGSGPPWYEDGAPFTGEGPPPWAPAHGFRAKSGEVADGDRPGVGPPFEVPGPRPWAGRDDVDDEDDGAGPPWYADDPHDGDGPPPWAGRGGRRGLADTSGD